MSDTIQTHTLRDGETEVTVLSMGCVIQDWTVGGRRVILGYQDIEDYRGNPASMAITVGRVANRTAQCQFEMDGETYTLASRGGPHHLHGGPGGIGWRNWTMEPQGETAVRLTLHSPDGDQGYPGAVDFEVMLTLDGPALTWEMTATPDRKTPINMAQHVYFNLAGEGTIREHSVRLNASHVTPTDETLIPTGEIMPVDGTRYDFREPRVLSEIDPEGQGYDWNFALDGGDVPQVEIASPDGMRLTLWTNRKGLQFYTGGFLTSHGTRHAGVRHGPFAGFCIEAQDFPNTLNTPAFGSIFCTPDSPYHQRTTIRIARD
ncbi:aldose epimerase family protein [Primorskyibacter sp. 2E107]|uniref:aldose epimerase family protein n=1 Tax=Primorskyibacter sp. 2E107 TaxID=3403458 RepID=UPI003AF8AD79